MPDKTRYHFVPYVRRGYSPSRPFKPSAAASSGGVSGGSRMDVTLTPQGESDGGWTDAKNPPTVTLDMLHPGYITGFDPRQVVRTDPSPGTMDLSPNYFASVEFETPDLPWLFSPVAAKNGKALPWMTLIVVERTEETRLKPAGSRPLPSLPAPVDELQPAHETWAWAHAQVAGEPPKKDHFAGPSNKTRARLISPRNLRPNRAYIAAVVPIFKAGQHAGLGREMPEPSNNLMAFAWTGDSSGPIELPVYFSWEFGTGRRGDFEYFVRALEPRNLNGPDYAVGSMDIDVTDPGMPDLVIQPSASDDLRTVRLEGALRKIGGLRPQAYPKADALRDILNTDEVTTDDGETWDVIGPPIYGGWHALRWKLSPSPEAPDRWLYDLNLHPGWRIAAGLGARIVREQQESLMASAWEQFGRIREANRLLALAQLSQQVMTRSLGRFRSDLSRKWLLQFTGPAHGRVRMNGKTIAGHLAGSTLPNAAASAAFRRLMRPTGPLADVAGADELADALEGGVSVREVADGAPSVEDDRGAAEICDALTAGEPAEPEPVADEGVRRLLEIIAELSDLLHALLKLAASDGALRANAEDYRDRHLAAARRAETLYDALYDIANRRPPPDAVTSGFTSDMLDRWRPDFGEALEAATLRPSVEPGDAATVTMWLLRALALLRQLVSRYFDLGGGATETFFERICARIPDPAPERHSPDMEGAGKAFDFVGALKKRVYTRIGGIDPDQREAPFDQVMAYPKFPQPMYRDLKDISETYLLPGVDQIPPNTVGVLETNPAFIEAFMTGLNHEMASELQWRRYATDRRGSYFRQFWDPSTRVPPPDEPAYDITELHTWDAEVNQANPLGSNSGTIEEGSLIVVIVRGDLLKRYPNTTIYAAKARTLNSDPDKRVPHWLSENTDARNLNRDHHRFPLFRAKLDPDITCLGFDLTAEQAAGAEDGLGWFIVFQEAPGDIRFGLDAADGNPAPPAGIEVGGQTPSETNGQRGWAGLTWSHIPQQGGDPSNIKVLTLADARPTVENWSIAGGDDAAQWGRSSADMARILWQKPVRVAIHADDLIPVERPNR